MSDELPPLRGPYDDMCPESAEVEAPRLPLPEDDDELANVAVLGYN